MSDDTAASGDKDKKKSAPTFCEHAPPFQRGIRKVGSQLRSEHALSGA
jgi:hypothetical protein